MDETRTPWAEIIGLSVIAVVLYNVGFLLVLFLVPMQILFVRRGEAGFKYGLLVFLTGVLLVKVIFLFTAGSIMTKPWLASLDFLLPLAFLGALYFLDTDHIGRLKLKSPIALHSVFPPSAADSETETKPAVEREMSIATRLLLATVSGAVISLPLVLYLLSSQALVHTFKAELRFAQNILQQSGDAAASNKQMISTDQMAKMGVSLFTRVYAFGFFLMIYLNWHLGTRIGQRTLFGVVRRASLEDNLRVQQLSVPEYMLWPLIAAWGIVLLSLYVNIGPAGPVAWNLALVTGFLYGMQGVGIVQHLFQVKNVSRAVRYLVLVVAIALLFMTGPNLIVLVGFPLLGVSETWIHYRRNKRS